MDLKEPLIKANRVLKYSITYQEITEESREYGEVSDSGFIIENETDEIGNLLKLAVETYGIYYPVAFGWWESTYPVQNRDYFEKGIEIYYALHITNEDGTDITENESDFITFLLSDGNYNKDEFTEYAIGGIVAGAIALGIGGLIAYYYFNKGKKGYPTGRAWTKEHYNDNDDEDYEVSPNERNIKHKARNRQFDNGGEIIRFDRHASMDSATRNELVEMTSYPFLLEYGVEENGEIKYDRIKSLLEREGVKVYSIKNYLSGLFDGYNYSNTDDFKKEMAKLKIADKEFYDRIIKVYEKISKYPKIDKMMANGGGIEKEKSLRHFILEQVSSGMIANKIPYSDYKTIDAIRFTALQILNRDGDREYSMKSFSDLIQEALLEYEENKYENKFANGGEIKVGDTIYRAWFTDDDGEKSSVIIITNSLEEAEKKADLIDNGYGHFSYVSNPIKIKNKAQLFEEIRENEPIYKFNEGGGVDSFENNVDYINWQGDNYIEDGGLEMEEERYSIIKKYIDFDTINGMVDFDDNINNSLSKSNNYDETIITANLSFYKCEKLVAKLKSFITYNESNDEGLTKETIFFDNDDFVNIQYTYGNTYTGFDPKRVYEKRLKNELQGKKFDNGGEFLNNNTKHKYDYILWSFGNENEEDDYFRFFLNDDDFGISKKQILSKYPKNKKLKDWIQDIEKENKNGIGGEFYLTDIDFNIDVKKFADGGNVSQTQLDAYRFVDEIVEIHKDKNKVKQVILDRVNSAYGRTSNQFVDEMWDRYNMIFYKEDYPHLFTDGGKADDYFTMKDGSKMNKNEWYQKMEEKMGFEKFAERELKDAQFGHKINAPLNELTHNRLDKKAVIGKNSVTISSYTPNYKRHLDSITFYSVKELNDYLNKNQILANGGMAGLGEVSGMLPNALPMSTITPMANGGEIKTLEKSLENAEKNYRKAILSEQVGIISPTELNRAKNKVDSIRAKVNEWYASRPLGKRMANGGEIQVGNKFGDWSITQYNPIVYEVTGGTRDGLIKLVNQDTFDEILVQYDGALRNPKWFAISKGVMVEGKSPKEVIEKLKFDNGGGVGEQNNEYWERRENLEMFLNLNDEDIYWKWVNGELTDLMAVELIREIHGVNFDATKKYDNGGGVNEKENNRYWKPINEQTLSFYNLTQNSSLQEIDYDDTFLNGKVWIAFRKLPNEVTQIPYEVKMLIKEDFEYYSYGANGSFIKVSLMEGSWFSMYIDFENLTFKHLEEMLLQLPLQVEERLEDKNIKGYGELGFYDYGQSIELEISNTFSKANGGGVENAEMPTRERTTITKPTTTPTTTPSKPDKKNPYKPKHIPKPKARK